ncbi:MAG: DUF4199 domain-containing protein [Cyclobacteriaceae bacterium]
MNANAIKSGVILAVIGIVISLLIYLIDFTIFANWWYQLLLMNAISIGITAYFGVTYRNENDGFLSFGKSYVYSIICLLVAGVVGTIFSILLFTVIDPELSVTLTDVIIEKTESMMAGFGAPQDAIDEQMEKLRTDMPENFSVGGMIKSFFTGGLIMNAIIALIAALFIKKKEPEFEG